MIYLSTIIKKPVYDSQGNILGRISDLAISTGEVFPRITSLAFVGPGKTPFMISWRKYVDVFDDDDGVKLKVPQPEIRFSYLQPSEVLLARDLLLPSLMCRLGRLAISASAPLIVTPRRIGSGVWMMDM